MIHNPYLDELKSVPKDGMFGFNRGKYTSVEFGDGMRYVRDNRKHFVTEYSWAIPSDVALRAIKEFSPRVCEIGAGTGYWAYMLKQYGVDIVAYDIAVPTHTIKLNKWGHKKTWFDVKDGDVLSINQHQDRALMLCWPPYSESMAATALKFYGGKKVIYIGEDDGGCTGDEAFHNKLANDYEQVNIIELPQWDGIHDALYLYERK